MKKVVVFLCVLLAVTTCVLPASAAVNEQVIDISECVTVDYDASGDPLPQPREAYGASAIAAFATRTFRNDLGGPFALNASNRVQLSFSFETTVYVAIGYQLNGQTVICGRYNSQNPVCVIDIPVTGSYTFVVQNLSATGIYMSGGSITQY